LGKLLRDPGSIIGIGLVVTVLALAILAPILSPHDPNFLYDDGTSDTGAPLGHTAKFLLGTDPQGRDVLSRLLWSSRVSLAIAGVAMTATAVMGVLVGCLAGYFRGWVDMLLMRVTDVLLAFPPVLLAMALAAAFGAGFGSVVVVVAAVAWPPLARTVYAQVLTVRERDFVEAARALGASNLRILARHVAPQVVPLMLVYTTLGVATAVSLESTLSFLGLGIPATDLSWGVMVNIALDYYQSDPPLLLYPALAIILTVLGFTLVGEGLRRAMASV
ncbi:MAG TPA: ABC transporter permease, partial [Chloroflexota bacterium]|nr:ABC transporter permease [Chloroflexota bacterium]